MYFTITHTFKEGVGEKRMDVRPQHIQYLKDCGDRLMVAGPMKDAEADKAPQFSHIIIRADSETAAKLFTEHDPYVQNGLVEVTEIRPFNAVLGSWLKDS